MKKLTFRLLAILLPGCGAAQAATVQLNGDNNADAIIGLENDGSFYDVIFGSAEGFRLHPSTVAGSKYLVKIPLFCRVL